MRIVALTLPFLLSACFGHLPHNAGAYMGGKISHCGVCFHEQRPVTRHRIFQRSGGSDHDDAVKAIADYFGARTYRAEINDPDRPRFPWRRYDQARYPDIVIYEDEFSTSRPNAVIEVETNETLADRKPESWMFAHHRPLHVFVPKGEAEKRAARLWPKARIWTYELRQEED